MSVNIAWYVPDKVIYVAVSDSISLEDSTLIAHQLTKLVSSTSQTLQIVINLNAIETHATNIHLLSSIITPLFFMSQLRAVIAYTTDSTVRKTLTSTMTSMFRSRVRTVDTEDNARAALQKVDSSLSDLQSIADVIASSR